ncbi:MAG: hypothetical protein WAQ24_04610 [Candidatus Saccharimonadales bacterium]
MPHYSINPTIGLESTPVSTEAEARVQASILRTIADVEANVLIPNPAATFVEIKEVAADEYAIAPIIDPPYDMDYHGIAGDIVSAAPTEQSSERAHLLVLANDLSGISLRAVLFADQGQEAGGVSHLRPTHLIRRCGAVVAVAEGHRPLRGRALHHFAGQLAAANAP